MRNPPNDATHAVKAKLFILWSVRNRIWKSWTITAPVEGLFIQARQLGFCMFYTRKAIV